MAAQYDAFGTYLGDYETEEERKKREELANTAVHSQEIKTYGDGTQEKITKEEIPGAIAPKTVSTPAGPVAPDTFARMQQAESGNRDYDAQGRPITSPVGAMFKNQVMPATAANPGYGIKPAAAQTPEEYNRVGQEYYQAMLKQFGGDERAAAAAYNAGPGRIQKNMAANQGQMNEGQLPKETQGYLQKVLGGVGNVVNAVIPSAQASTLRQPPANVGSSGFQAYDRNRPGNAAYQGAPVVPNYAGPGQGEEAQTVSGAVPGAIPAPVAGPAMPGQAGQAGIQTDDQGNKLITNPDGTTTVLGPNNQPLAAGGMVPQDTATFKNRLFEEAGKDPMKWMEIAKNPEYSQFTGMQAVAKQQARTLLEQEFKLDATTKEVEKTVAAATAGDPKAGRAIADELKKQEGSWAKMILLGFLSPQLAGEEAVKLGFGDKWTSVTDDQGHTAMIKVNAKGMPLSGITADNQPLSETELARFASGAGGKKMTKPDVSLQDVQATIDGKQIKGRVVTTYDKNQKPTTQVESGGKYYAYSGDWKPVSIETAGAKAEQAAGIKLKYAGPTSYTEAGAKAAGEHNFKYGTNIGYASQTPGAPLVDLNTGTTIKPDANGVIQATQSGTPGSAPAITAGGQTPAQMETATKVGAAAQTQFQEKTVPALMESGANGRDVAGIRRQQIGIINSNPSILGIYNGTGTNYDRARNTLTKLLTGEYGSENSGDFYKDIKDLGLKEGERAALEQILNLNMGINQKTLRANAGPGAVSNIEQKINANSNLSNLAQTTPLGALQTMYGSKFNNDLQHAKSTFAQTRPELNTDLAFNREWDKEQTKWMKAYEGIAEARAEYLKPFRPPASASKEQLDAFKDKTYKAFELYPSPTFDPGAPAGKQWSYVTTWNEKAVAKKLLGR